MIKNLSLIAAIGNNNELGINNKLIWHIKEDLKSFKNITMNSNIIMGMNTYNSIPQKLEGRKYIVMTRKDIILDNVQIYHSKEDVIKNINNQEKYIVIGGEQIYKLFIEDVYIMYITHINDTFKLADAYFPKFDENMYDKALILEGSENNINYKQFKYTRRLK